MKMGIRSLLPVLAILSVCFLLLTLPQSEAAPLLPAQPPRPPANPDAVPLGVPDAAGPDLESHAGSFRAAWPVLPEKTTSHLVQILYKRMNYPRPKELTREGLWAWTIVEDVNIANQNQQPGRQPPAAPATPRPKGTAPMPAGVVPATQPASRPAAKSKPPAEHDPNPGYFVYIPRDYHPGKLYGLLVFLDPGRGSAADRYRGYADLCDKRHLIWIAPADIGNDRPTPWRLFRATEAIVQAHLRFTVDPQRTYVSGMSGGGRVSSIAALLYADLFAGGIYVCGCNYATNVPAGGNRVYPGFWQRPDAAVFARAKRDGRYVLLTGTKDFNRDNTKSVLDAYQHDAFAHVTFLDVPEMGHTMPSAEWYAKGLTALDEPLPPAEQLIKQAQTAEQAGKKGEAYQLYGRAAALAAARDEPADAGKQAAEIATRLYDEYSKQVVAVRALQKAADPKAPAELAALRKAFAPLANE